ncbi:MAG: hypothetical protein KatS3mg008_1365 [Acidimicrobiales bacterium]|nr:MAG: hypothetical protein KatS3mg008_1365 [Acidimicrobiales bacterium]
MRRHLSVGKAAHTGVCGKKVTVPAVAEARPIRSQKLALWVGVLLFVITAP